MKSRNTLFGAFLQLAFVCFSFGCLRSMLLDLSSPFFYLFYPNILSFGTFRNNIFKMRAMIFKALLLLDINMLFLGHYSHSLLLFQTKLEQTFSNMCNAQIYTKTLPKKFWFFFKNYNYSQNFARINTSWGKYKLFVLKSPKRINW